jgi:hypothetical protein
MRNLFSLAVALLLPWSALAQEKPLQTPLLQDGVLQKLHAQLEQIFQFTLDGPRLKLDRRRWADAPKEPPKVNVVASGATPIEQIFSQIRATVGFGGSSTMSAGSRYRELRFMGTTLSGRVLTRDENVRLELEEAGSPRRSLELQDDGQGSLRLMLSHADGDVILLLQTRQGACTVASVVGGKSFAAQAPSFLAAYKQHRQVFDADILPVLDGLSIRLFVPPSSQQLKAAVRAMLLRSPQLLKEGAKLLADLDSEQFVVRDQASRLLNERFEVYQDLIEAKLKEPGLTVETDRRLQKILAAHADSRKISEVIAALELLKDPPFLVGLLEETPADQRGPIIARLEEITGQRLGQDIAAWKRWRGKKK